VKVHTLRFVCAEPHTPHVAPLRDAVQRSAETELTCLATTKRKHSDIICIETHIRTVRTACSDIVDEHEKEERGKDRALRDASVQRKPL